MNRPKKNSTVAQASLNLNTEAAIKLLPPASQTNFSKDAGPTDKDGYDGGSEVMQFLVEVAINGFMITIVFIEDLPDLKYVVQTMDEVIDIMRGNF